MVTPPGALERRSQALPRCDGCGQPERLRTAQGYRERLRQYGRATDEGTMKADLCAMCALTVQASRDNPDILRRLATLLEQAGPGDAPLREARLRDDRPTPPPERRGRGLKAYLRAIEADEILRAIAEADGNRTKAADMLGMNRTCLVQKIAYMGLRDRL